MLHYCCCFAVQLLFAWSFCFRFVVFTQLAPRPFQFTIRNVCGYNLCMYNIAPSQCYFLQRSSLSANPSPSLPCHHLKTPLCAARQQGLGQLVPRLLSAPELISNWRHISVQLGINSWAGSACLLLVVCSRANVRWKTPICAARQKGLSWVSSSLACCLLQR